MMLFLSFLPFCHLAFAVVDPQTDFTPAVSVSIPLIAPTSAPFISPSFVGLSIEQDRWMDWVSTPQSKNQYFVNLLDNLKKLTNYPPDIRIGADSEDHTNFRADINPPQVIFPDFTKITPYPEATNITVGDAFYQAVQSLPPDTKVIWGLNFGQNNMTAALLSAQSIIKAFSSEAVRDVGITLDAIEIGNEADLYPNNKMRQRTYNISQYVQEWTTFASNIIAVMGITPNSPTRLWGCSFSTSSIQASGFGPQSAFAQGLLSSKASSNIAKISQHHYSGTACFGGGALLQNLMTKSTIRSNLTKFLPDIQATRARGLEYILGETNSYSCHGAPGVANVAGASLWALDYLLFASQVGISKIFFHEGIGYKYNLIQPVTLTRSILDGSPLPEPLPPHIHAQYYSAIIAAEAIGQSGQTRVVELDINNANVTGYAFYEGQKPVRAVFINLEAYFRNDDDPRRSVHLDIDFGCNGILGSSSMTVVVKRFIIGYADDTKGFTWGGQNYETPDGKVGGDLDVQYIPLSNGVDIKATEAVMLSFS